MAKFNIKDLMVSLEAQKLEANQFCFHFTCGYISCGYCSFRPTMCHTATCPGGTIICQFNTHPTCIAGSCGITEVTTWTTWRETTVIQEVIPHLDVKELGELKTALQIMVEKIDTEHKPAKAQQLDNLEAKLHEAIKEVQDQKKNLKK